MDNIDVTVLRALCDWRAAGRHALLVTVVRTWGSSPRPVGSIMALCEDGAVMGSVSGGCIEDDLIARYARAGGGADALPREAANDALPRVGAPQFTKYGISADEAHRFGLPCGGTLELLLEFDPDAASLAELVAALDAGRLMRRSVNLADGTARLTAASARTDLSVSATELTNIFGPEWRMLIIGAGQMSEYLATMALFTGFAVTVCDPREEYRGAWAVPGARLLPDMPDDVVTALKPDERTAVIALTHDPKLDDMALLEALQTDAFYIGAIGSRRNNAARRERMIKHFDQTDDSLKNLRGPVGIYIGSKTPPEIAVSIMAEVLAVKNGVTLPRDLDVAHVKNTQGAAAGASACAVG